MGRETVDKCNRCDVVRGATNHWWMLRPAGEGLTIQPFNEKLLGRQTEIYCGEECLLARVSEFISVRRWYRGHGAASIKPPDAEPTRPRYNQG